MIVGCGEYKPGEDWQIAENDGTNDVYPPFPEDWDDMDNITDNKQVESIISDIKESGNIFYKSQDFVESDKKYRKALRYIQCFKTKPVFEKCDERKVRDTEIQCSLNLAAVRLKKSRFQDALNCCNHVLAAEPKNSKALYRRALALKGIKDYKEAVRDLKTAMILSPNDKKINSEFKIVQTLLRSYLSQEKMFFSNMFK